MSDHIKMGRGEMSDIIANFSPPEMQVFYNIITQELKLNRHSNCEFQFQRILAVILDDGSSLIEDCIKKTGKLILPPPEDPSWNDKREIDGIWH